MQLSNEMGSYIDEDTGVNSNISEIALQSDTSMSEQQNARMYLFPVYSSCYYCDLYFIIFCSRFNGVIGKNFVNMCLTSLKFS